MHSFLGLPYIDVRVSFNSFIPKFLDEKISAKLVDYYLDTLAKNPHLHDKVEFDIVYSCYDLNIANRLKKLLDFGFNEFELKRIEFSLLELTNKILDPKDGLYIKDLARIEVLKTRFNNIVSSNMSRIDKIYWLNEDCKRFGTPPFAGIARAAFVAMAILNSLVEINFLSIEEKWAFLNSLQTISKKLSIKTYELSLGLISKEEFLSEFGHLRAGTYNILTPSYQNAFSMYFDKNISSKPISKGFWLSKPSMRELDLMLSLHGFKINAEGLFNFISTNIEGREYAKFIFTKSLSKILDLLEEKSTSYDIPLEDFAHIDYSLILKNYSNLDSTPLKAQLLENIEKNKLEYEYTKCINLPPLITSPRDAFSYHCNIVTPNFIGQKNVSAYVVLESNLQKHSEDGCQNSDCETNYTGAIALIESADPGYDFLFTKGIAGLVTCYGGANSHMAIRCSELGIPACIGIGQEKFMKLKNSKKIFINCQDSIIHILQ